MRSLSLYRFAGNGDRFDRCRKLIKTLTLKPKERTCAIALARYQASLAHFLEMLDFVETHYAHVLDDAQHLQHGT